MPFVPMIVIRSIFTLAYCHKSKTMRSKSEGFSKTKNEYCIQQTGLILTAPQKWPHKIKVMITECVVKLHKHLIYECN